MTAYICNSIKGLRQKAKRRYIVQSKRVCMCSNKHHDWSFVWGLLSPWTLSWNQRDWIVLNYYSKSIYQLAHNYFRCNGQTHGKSLWGTQWEKTLVLMWNLQSHSLMHAPNIPLANPPLTRNYYYAKIWHLLSLQKLYRQIVFLNCLSHYAR